MTADTATDALRDRLAIEDVLYRYGSCIDRRDGPGLEQRPNRRRDCGR